MPRRPRFKVTFLKVPWLRGKGEMLVQTEKRTSIYQDNSFYGSLVSEMRFRRKK